MRPTRPSTLRSALRRFGREEEGSMVVFAMFIFIAMLIVGGMSVDLMRFETNRARLQATLDRAVLAAADLDQTGDCQGVVEEYVDKAQFGDNLTSVNCVETINSRMAEATAEIELDTFFMDLVGVDTLDAPGASTAMEAVSDIEIMLVLDVSGSMLSNNRLVNLQAAANEFVQTVLANDAENRISVGIVPFNGQVNLGAALRAKFNVTDQHGVANSNCVDLPASAYASLSMSRTAPMPMTAWADTFSTTSQSTSYVNPQGPTATNRWCPATAGNVVRLPARNVATLQGAINGLTGIGATSINAGMRWGMTLLDPAQRPMFNEFISAGQIPGFFAGRPYNWDREDTMKVIVLMTDGEHFAEERVNAGFRSGMSPIYRSGGDGTYSIHHPSRTQTNKFWVPHRGEWRATAWNSGSGVTQLSWQQVWADLRVSWVAWQLYARALWTSSGQNITNRTTAYNTQMELFRTLTPTTSMDDQLQVMCNRAEDQNVVVFGIAFEAPANGQTQIFNCASSPSHYYNAQGLEIRSAFRAIAARINALRLIQ